MPVPASTTTRVPDSERTSTHEVLPPYRSVFRPGTGREPRTPQNFTRIGRPKGGSEDAEAWRQDNTARLPGDRRGRVSVSQPDRHFPCRRASFGAGRERKKCRASPSAPLGGDGTG